jgi:hypothetical protein
MQAYGKLTLVADADAFHRLLKAAKRMKSARAPLPVAKECEARRISRPQKGSTPKGNLYLEPPSNFQKV